VTTIFSLSLEGFEERLAKGRSEGTKRRAIRRHGRSSRPESADRDIQHVLFH